MADEPFMAQWSKEQHLVKESSNEADCEKQQPVDDSLPYIAQVPCCQLILVRERSLKGQDIGALAYLRATVVEIVPGVGKTSESL